MEIITIINECISELKEEDYRGDHSAPEPDSSTAPLYDLTKNFDEDLYSPDAARLYGNHDPNDRYTMAIIQSARNRPNKQITVYRAVPKIITNTEKINDYRKQLAYVMKTGKIPRGVDNWTDRSEYYEWLSNEIEKLSAIPDDESRVKINSGDWVTINPVYAKEHGQNNLRNKYRIIRKTVSAKNLWWDGGDINEWGYYT